MAGKNRAVFGIFPEGEAVESAVDALLGAGFSSGAIAVLLPDPRSSREFAHHKVTKAPEGAAAGATAGGFIGGTLGVLAGVGALALPWLGPLIAAGPIVAALAGLGVGGAMGGLMGALVGLGIPEYEAKRYEGRVRDGGTLLSVHCDTAQQVKTAKGVLKDTGAQDIATAGESAAADPGDRRAAAVSRETADPRVARDPRFASNVSDPYGVDRPDAADPSHPRIFR